MRQVRKRNAGALVFHRQHDAVSVRIGARSDAGTRPGIFRGIVQQIDQGLLQQQWIGADEGQISALSLP